MGEQAGVPHGRDVAGTLQWALVQAAEYTQLNSVLHNHVHSQLLYASHRTLHRDLLPRRCRLELSRGDWRAVKAGLEKARGLCDKGGDWERKNKLKVGQGQQEPCRDAPQQAAAAWRDAAVAFISPGFRCMHRAQPVQSI